jgi:hydroxymethylpyrimidine kinase / phosphomethylpyrimidine kinase / thiamine-phosphate diphosphorylase
MKNLLTIAGHDPSSGAGITKDLEIFSALQCHPLTAPTALVIQGPKGVRDVYPVPPDRLGLMLRTIAEEVRVDGVKIGVACDVHQVVVIADFLKSQKGVPVVLDPVLSAKNGHVLLSKEGLKALMEQILPLTSLITPNTEEATILTGSDIIDRETMKAAGQALRQLGVRTVLVKGGHVSGEPTDLLLDEEDRALWWQRRRINRTIHGTGCTLSSLVLAFLSNGLPLGQAFRQAERTIDEMLNNSYQIGPEGYFYTSLTLLKSQSAERWDVIAALKKAMERFILLNMVELIPEVQMNIGYAVPNPKGAEDIAAYPGRIGRCQGGVVTKGEPQFGASSHVARMILSCMKCFPFVRACANIRYSEEALDRAKEKGMGMVFADHQEEPDSLKGVDEGGFDSLVTKALESATTPPDIIYDLGCRGKEPMIRLFARDPEELLHKMEMIRPWKIS